MADEKIILSIEVDSTQAEKNVTSLTGEIKNLEQENNNLKKSIKAGDDEMGKNSKTLAVNQNKLRDLKKEREANINVQKTAVNTNKTLTQTITTEARTLNELKTRNSELIKIRNNVDISSKKGKQQFDELNKSIKVNTNEIKKAEAEGGNFARNVGNYGDALSSVPGPIGMVVNGIKSMTRAALAFIATPIGAIIGAIGLALGALIRYFKGSEEGQNRLNKVSMVFKTIFGNLDDIIQRVGKAIVDAVTKPKETIQKLGQLIKENLINRFEAFGKIGKAIAKIFSGEFKEGLKDLANAGGQLVTGIEDPIDKIKNAAIKTKDAIKGLGEEMKREVEIAKGLADAQAALDLKIRDNIVKEAKQRSEIAEIRAKATDKENNSAEERLKLLNKAFDLENNILKRNEEIAKEKARIKTAQNALSNSTKEDLDEQAQLEAEVFRVQQTNAEKRRRLESERQTAIREINAAIKKGANDDEKFNQKRIDAINELAQLESEQKIKHAKDAEEELQLKSDALDKDRKQELEKLGLKSEEIEDLKNELSETELENELERRGIAYEEYLLLEEEHQIALDELKEEYAEKERKRLDELTKENIDNLTTVLDAAGQFADDRIGIATGMFQDLMSIENDLKNGRISDEEAANERIAAGTQALTNFVTSLGNQQLENYKANKDEEVAKMIAGGMTKEEAEKEFARKLAQKERTQFNLSKAAALLNVGIQTALGITKTIGNLGLPLALPFIAIAGGLGLAQAAIIASKKPPAVPSFEKGGGILPFGGTLLGGKPHSMGGTKIYADGHLIGEAQRGEGMFITKDTATQELLSGINEKHGGRSFFSGKTSFAQEGGQIGASLTGDDITKAMKAALMDLTIVTQVEDITTGINRRQNVLNNSVI